MSETITTRKDIPNAPYYVLSNDRVMSGWGPATNKTNTVICPCHTYAEAQFVMAYAKSRSDQSKVRIVSNKPRLNSYVLYSLMEREESSWYTAYFTVSRSIRDGSLKVTMDTLIEDLGRNSGQSKRPVYLHTTLNTMFDVISFCASWAHAAGARQMEINPL